MTQIQPQPRTLSVRSEPDPSAPNASSRLALILIDIPTGLLTVLGIPIFIIHYILARPGIPLRTWLIAKIIRTMGNCIPWLPVAESEAKRWAIPSTYGGAARGISTTRVTVPPAPEPLLDAYAIPPPKSNIKPIPMPGYLLGGEGPASPGEHLYLYFHGGAYCRGHPLWTALPSYIAKDLNVRVFAGQYRKCVTPDTVYPGPLIDALAAWHYVTTTLKFDPANIIISGDSAGGHLCLALLQQLGALGVPLPGAAALISPWADFTLSFPEWETQTNDYLTRKLVQTCVKSIVRYYTPEAVAGPLFSPALAPEGHWKFLQNTPILVSEGTAEVFHGEDEALITGLKRDGVHVDVQRDVGGLHVGPIIDLVLRTNTGEYTSFVKGVGKLYKMIDEKSDTVSTRTASTITVSTKPASKAPSSRAPSLKGSTAAAASASASTIATATLVN